MVFTRTSYFIDLLLIMKMNITQPRGQNLIKFFQLFTKQLRNNIEMVKMKKTSLTWTFYVVNIVITILTSNFKW